MRGFWCLVLGLLCAVGWGQIPPGTGGVTRTQAQSLGLQARNGGWTVIGSHVAHAGAGIQASVGGVPAGTRIELVSPWTYVGLRVGFCNWWVNGCGESPNTNDEVVKSSFGYQGSSVNEAITDTIAPFTFNGQLEGWNRKGTFMLSDPNWLAYGIAGERSFIKSSATAPIPPAPATSTITLSASGSNSHLVATTYYVTYSLVYPGFVETLCAPVTSILISAQQAIIVAPPTAVAGAIGYKVYLSTTATPTTVYDAGTGFQPFGNNSVIYYYGPAIAGGLAAQTWPRNSVGSTLYFAYQMPGVLGGAGAGASNNGEYYTSTGTAGLDASLDQLSLSANANGTSFGPAVVLGFCPDGVHPSVAIVGDSIANATWDSAYGWQDGGYIQRAVMGQTSQYPYNVAQTPLYGHLSVATSGETASTFATDQGIHRSQLAAYCTDAIVEYGTNDLTGAGATPIISSLITIHQRFLNLGMYVSQTTILPKTSSTDAWTTITNQTVGLGSNQVEADRRQLNNWIVDNISSNVVTNDTLFRVASAAYGSSANPYSGGDGTTTKFETAYAFVEGSETISVNGVAQSQSAYTYLYPTTINGVTYASGITFTSAPGSGLSITGAYTKISGYRFYFGGSAKIRAVYNVNPAVEVNGSGTPQLNGGFWLPASTIYQTISGGATFTLTTLTLSGAGWTQDQWRNAGASLRVVSDSTAPTAVGQVRAIQSNTTTAITIQNSWTVIPDSNAVIAIQLCPTDGGTHPTSWTHLLLALQMGITSSSLSYP